MQREANNQSVFIGTNIYPVDKGQIDKRIPRFIILAIGDRYTTCRINVHFI